MSLLVSEVVHDTHFPRPSVLDIRPRSYHPPQPVVANNSPVQHSQRRPSQPARALSDNTATGHTSMARPADTTWSASSSTTSHAPATASGSTLAQPGSRQTESTTSRPLPQAQTSPHQQQIPEAPTAATEPPQSHDTYAPLYAAPTTPTRTKIKNLKHIERILEDESDHLSAVAADSNQTESGPTYDISNMPIGEVIEMVAGLLMKITTTNDKQYQHLHHHIPPIEGPGVNSQVASMTAFHGRCVPNISILAYLNRINKYCPTTYEVFLSLLVYLDRMSGRVNNEQIEELRREVREEQDQQERDSPQGPSALKAQPTFADSPPSSLPGSSPEVSRREDSEPSPPLSDSDPLDLSRFFAVDSLNIHRLIIAGITAAAKFFSDVFYTNSRYAKVGGLPLQELNHLELNFLLLNEFRLTIPMEEMDAYATMLVQFYARQIVAQRLGDSHDDDLVSD